MPLVSSLELALIIPKSIEILLFILNIYFINKKNRDTAWKDRPQFHRSFLMGMMAWTVYIFLDIFIYTCAGLSMNESTPVGTYQGYTSGYVSVTAVNILRDIGFVGSVIMSWNYLIAGFALRYDEEKVKAVFTKNKLILFLMGAITIIITAGDLIQVSVSENDIDVSGVFNGFAGFTIGLNVFIYLTTAVMLYLTLKSITKDDPSKDLKKRIGYFLWGVICMGFGHLYWLILGLIAIYAPASLGVLPILFYYYLGHAFWTISPVLIYFGFARAKKRPSVSNINETSTDGDKK